jgi:hypothetical protein
MHAPLSVPGCTYARGSVLLYAARSQAKILAQVLIMGGTIVVRAFGEAYQKALISEPPRPTPSNLRRAYSIQLSAHTPT